MDGGISLATRLERIEESIEKLRIDTENRFAKVEAAFGWKMILAFIGITGSGWGVAISLLIQGHK